MKPLKVVKYLVVHCVSNRCDRPFSVESLINCGKQKYGQVSYHYYVRILGHCEFPRVAKRCPCYLPSKEYSQLNGNQK